MRTVVAGLVAALCGLVWLVPVMAAPPQDVAAYCRAVYPQAQFQARCLNVEHAAAERVSRVAAAADRDSFDRCLAITSSWASMEGCLSRVARGGSAAGVGGAMTPVAPGMAPAGIRPGEATARPSSETAPGTSTERYPAGSSPDLEDGPVGTATALGPSPTDEPVEPARPTHPISEADAERQLRAVLERVGEPAAHCTKKQYGPGWASICE